MISYISTVVKNVSISICGKGENGNNMYCINHDMGHAVKYPSCNLLSKCILDSYEVKTTLL